MKNLNSILKYTEKNNLDILKKENLVSLMETPEKYNSIINKDSIELLKNVKGLLDTYMEIKVEKSDVLSEPKKVIEFAKFKLNGCINEKMILIYLNTKNEVIEHDIHAEGTIDQCLVYPRRIAKDCLENNAAGLIIFHNHPSGHCYPSKEDIIITKKIKDCISIIDVNLLDHIIIANNDYYSFQEEKALL